MTTETTTTEATKTMKAAILEKNGDPTTAEILSVKDDVVVPEPGKDQLLVKVVAAAINPVDWKLMKGEFPGQKSGTCGSDVCGTIEKIGPDTTTDLKVGDAIYADAIATKGSFAEYVLVGAKVASKKPSNITSAEAASLPLAGLTALQGLVNQGNLVKGQTVLIFGGTGGVGSLAIQMAKALGAAEVTSTGSNVEQIKSFGADVVVNYKEETLMDALKGKDFDIVYDTVGGLEHWQVAQASLKKGGIFVTIVGDGGSLLNTIGGVVLRKLKSVAGGPQYKIFLTNTSYDGVTKDMAKITEMVEAGKVKPVLDERRFELTTEGIHEFIKASMSHRAKGKLILEVQKE